MAERRRRVRRINREFADRTADDMAAFIATTDLVLNVTNLIDLTRLYKGEVGPADISGDLDV